MSFLYFWDEFEFEDVMSVDFEGSYLYENLRAADDGADWQRMFEFPLYTDTKIVASLTGDNHPFELINTLAFNNYEIVRPAILLRVKHYVSYLPSDVPDMDKTRDDYYHGGELIDEITALVSLCLGIRLKNGGVNRIFESNGDPKGNPVALDTRNPFQSFVTSHGKLILPRARGNHDLKQAELIFSLSELSPADAIALIRAARMYQQAIWIAESTPELSWILLVSAVEAVMIRWTSNDDTEKTKRFKKFLKEFLPEAPNERRYSSQLKWSKKSLGEIFYSKIYEYRSRALHDGKPFPSPMCKAPIRLDENGTFSEKPLGATSTINATWKLEDTPMLLHTFEYIVRNAILKWWKSKVSENNN